MKLMIASDIHGSLYWCRKMMEAFRGEKPDKLILLGDLLYHGPRNDLPQEYAPKGVIQELNAVKEHVLCVRGNCEAEVDQMVLQFPVMAETMILFLDGRTVYATHGHIRGRQNPPLLQKGDGGFTMLCFILPCPKWFFHRSMLSNPCQSPRLRHPSWGE